MYIQCHDYLTAKRQSLTVVRKRTDYHQRKFPVGTFIPGSKGSHCEPSLQSEEQKYRGAKSPDTPDTV